MTTLPYMQGLRFIADVGGIDDDGNKLAASTLPDQWRSEFATGNNCARSIPVKSSDGYRWICNRDPGHFGDHCAVESIVRGGPVLAIWDVAAPLFGIEGALKALAENGEPVPSFPVLVSAKYGPEFEFGHDGVVFTQLPIPPGGRNDFSRQCRERSPNMGWPCTKEKGHYASDSPHRSTNYELNRCFALWKEK